MKLSELVEAYRKEHDLSQRQFAQICGLSNGFISMLEKNENPKTGSPLVPSIMNLQKLASGMNMSLRDIFLACEDLPSPYGDSNDTTSDWIAIYKKNLKLYWDAIMAEISSADYEDSGAEITDRLIEEILQNKRPLTFPLACEIAEQMDVSMDVLIGRDECEKATLEFEDGLSRIDKEILDFVKRLSLDQKKLLYAQLKTLVDSSKKEEVPF